MNYNAKSMTRIAGLFYIAVGVLCIVLRSGILDCIAYCAGFALILYGIFVLVRGLVMPGIILMVLGVMVLLTGWFMVTLILYIIAALMVLAGIEKLVRFYQNKAINDSIFRPEGIRSILFIICGILFLINPRGTVSVLFVIIGVLLIVMGITALLQDP